MNCQRSTSVSSVPHPRFTFIPSLIFCGINSVQTVDRFHPPTSAAMSFSPSGYQPRARDFIFISNGFALTLFPTTKHMLPTLFAWTDSSCWPISSKCNAKDTDTTRWGHGYPLPHFIGFNLVGKLRDEPNRHRDKCCLRCFHFS